MNGTPHEGAKWQGAWSGIGHAPNKETRQPLMDYVYQWNSRMMVSAIEALSRVKVGDATLFEQSVLFYTSDNGEDHHAGHGRWPFALVGNAGGKLKVDGRFLRFPGKAKTGGRPTNDLFASLALAFGVPAPEFGKGGNEIPKGPLETLMA